MAANHPGSPNATAPNPTALTPSATNPDARGVAASNPADPENTPPSWLTCVGPSIDASLPDWFAGFRPPPNPDRRASVLILAGRREGAVGPCDDPENVEIVLTERAHTMRSHAAQVAFPGGHQDPEDSGPVGAALREATEEVGLRPDTVDIVSELPTLFMHPRRNAVTPVIGWWRAPHEIGAASPHEVARVARVPVSDLVNPANRFTVKGPRGYTGPGFFVAGMFVWGFTAKLIDTVLTIGGIAEPYDTDLIRGLPQAQVAVYSRGG